MEGYVYIARIIDHGGKFVNGYHKIGLSKQYKVRETQLNSTHLPFDVLMVRVFETEDMKQLEGLLHICFEDYRVIKEYDYRKHITTEWFDVTDIDTFNDRLDKFIDLLGINEVNMNETIDSDTSLTSEEKEEVKKNVDLGSRTKRHDFRYRFWEQLLENYKKEDNLFNTINPGTQQWVGKRLTGVGELNFVATGRASQVELYINIHSTMEKEKNKQIFDKLYNQKENIENELGRELLWERRDSGRGSRISLKGNGNIYDENQWENMCKFLVPNMIEFSQVMSKYCNKIM